MILELFKISYILLIICILFASVYSQSWIGILYTIVLALAMLMREIIFPFLPSIFNLEKNAIINDKCTNKYAYIWSAFVNTQSIYALMFSLLFFSISAGSGYINMNIPLIVILCLLTASDIGIKYYESCGGFTSSGRYMPIFAELLFASISAVILVYSSYYAGLFPKIPKLNANGTCDIPDINKKMKCKVYKNGKIIN